jgi:hypothetical protein
MGYRLARGKKRIRPLSVAACVAIAIGAGGCSLIRSFPETAHKEAVRERVLETESTLSAAGFRRVPIKSAAEPGRVSSLPPLEIRYHIDNGRFRYWFADPEFCDCVFEGDEAAYQRFERLKVAAEKERSDRQAGQVHREGAQQTALDSVSSKNPFRWNWF